MLIDQNSLPVTLTRNQLLPDEGPRCIPLLLDFASQDTYELQAELLQSKAFLSILQTVWIDTSLVSQPLEFRISGGSQQTIKVSANTQGYYNVLVPNPIDIQISCPSGNAVATVILINVPIPGAIWQPSGGGGGGGTPGAPEFAIQFNEPLGTFAGDAGFLFDGAVFRNAYSSVLGPDESTLDPSIANGWAPQNMLVCSTETSTGVAIEAQYLPGLGDVGVIGLGVSVLGVQAESEGIWSYAAMNDGAIVHGVRITSTVNAGQTANQYTGLTIEPPALPGGASLPGGANAIHVANWQPATNANIFSTDRVIKTGNGMVEFGDHVYIGADQNSFDPFLQFWFFNPRLWLASLDNDDRNGVGIQVQRQGSGVGGQVCSGVVLGTAGASGFDVELAIRDNIDLNPAMIGYRVTADIDANTSAIFHGVEIRQPGLTGGAAQSENVGILLNDFSNMGAGADRAIKTGLGTVEFGDVVKYSGPNTTGAGAALLGANSPAGTLAAPYTWIEARAADGTVVFIPAWA